MRVVNGPARDTTVVRHGIRISAIANSMYEVDAGSGKTAGSAGSEGICFCFQEGKIIRCVSNYSIC